MMLQTLILKRRPTLILLFMVLMAAGALTYQRMNREAFPNTPIPLVFVDLHHSSLSPQEGEILVVTPLEKELKQLEGLKALSSWASVGHVRLSLEFHETCDPQQAYTHVHHAIQKASADLPADLPKPQVKLVNLATHTPILIMALTGSVPPKALHAQAHWLQKLLESVSGVLRVDLIGYREPVVHIDLSREKIQSLGLTPLILKKTLQEANISVAFDEIKNPPTNLFLPSRFTSLEALESLPLRTKNHHTLKLKDVAEVRLGLKLPETLVNHQDFEAVQLEIFIEPGQNSVELVKRLKAKGQEVLTGSPLKLHVVKDGSKPIVNLLKELESGLILASLLVIGVIFWALGAAPAAFVSLSLPGSFLLGLLALNGMSLNIVVLFSLILVTGMLVDGAIIVVEYAVHLQQVKKLSVAVAYAAAAQRMVGPVISATATVLMAFLPLILWPGVTGKFMGFLPVTVMSTLTASIIVALIFLPAVAPVILTGRASKLPVHATRFFENLETYYRNLLTFFLKKPGRTILGVTLIFTLTWILCSWGGRGVEFFPSVDPEEATLVVRSSQLMSRDNKQQVIKKLTERLKTLEGVDSLTSQSGGRFVLSDTLGKIHVKFGSLSPEACRRLVNQLHTHSPLPGFQVDVHTHKAGPANSGKPFQVLLQSALNTHLDGAYAQLATFLKQHAGLSGLEDTRNASALRVHIGFDRIAASRYGLTLQDMSGALGVLSQQGFRASWLQMPQQAEKIDIYLTCPSTDLLDPLNSLLITNIKGKTVGSDQVATYDVTRQPATRFHKDACPAILLSATLTPGASLEKVLADTQNFWANCKSRYPAVTLSFQGEQVARQESSNFLGYAFMVALGGIFLILMIQFNNLFQVVLVLTAVVMSSVGVALGLLITGQKFSIVMGGVGMIALAGIVVSNNIILIDTFNYQRQQGQDVASALITSCCLRLRPIILTKLTTILGLLPMVMELTVDFFEPNITLGAPSSQWWTQMATSIVFGVLFASLGTLIFTPCALMAYSKRGSRVS